MTREEAIEILQGAIKKPNTKDGYLGQAIDMAIKALEQEPILDKIRAEIKKLQKMCDKNDLNLMAQYSAFGMVLDILDKYKAEKEALADIYKPALKADLCIMDEFAFMPQAETEGT